ncbi:hypothetical protein L2E82_01954 [Cichorium intybus]|uniref:Uncharacterized protein n=1 Tax=Cichorium intybus TaxID=13427 RepID=A0ACB9H0B0_CICIN|nr:hypothetical protein L2E82_01954 [Cichorium intybus]
MDILGKASKLNHARRILLDIPKKGLKWDENLFIVLIASYGKAESQDIILVNVEAVPKLETAGTFCPGGRASFSKPEGSKCYLSKNKGVSTVNVPGFMTQLSTCANRVKKTGTGLKMAPNSDVGAGKETVQ